MNFEDLRACLEKDGWPVDVVSDVTLRSRFRSGERIFPLFVHLEPRPRRPSRRTPRSRSSPSPACRRTRAGDLLAERLLVLNREMNLAKFSVDEDGDVILSVEYPLADLDPSEVRDALDVLSFYAEKYRAEVEAAATASKEEGLSALAPVADRPPREPAHPLDRRPRRVAPYAASPGPPAPARGRSRRRRAGPPTGSPTRSTPRSKTTPPRPPCAPRPPRRRGPAPSTARACRGPPA